MTADVPVTVGGGGLGDSDVFLGYSIASYSVQCAEDAQFTFDIVDQNGFMVYPGVTGGNGGTGPVNARCTGFKLKFRASTPGDYVVRMYMATV